MGHRLALCAGAVCARQGAGRPTRPDPGRHQYEFGTDKDGTVILADEIHTPDSSRYWLAESYEQRFKSGERPQSFDKDFIRAWVTARCDPYKDRIPKIPAELIEQTSRVYTQAYETITGKHFVADTSGKTVLDRIRENLKRYF